MKAKSTLHLSILLILILVLNLVPQQTAAAQTQTSGGVAIFSVLPNRICVGDTLTINGGASFTYLEDAPEGLAWLPVTRVQIKATLGQVTPDQIIQENEGFYFNFTYKATTPGTETITITLNDGAATTQEQFEVEEKCDYDVYLLEVMHFTANMNDEQFSSITHTTGTGLLKRDRSGSHLFDGEGTWHLEEIILSKPSNCVEYYMPPIILSGPFKLEGKLSDAGDTVGVRLNFLPKQGESVYHGQSVCIDEDGNAGYGWSISQGGDPSMAATIEAAFMSGGGSQTVEMEGSGMDLVQTVGQTDYTASMTLILR